MQRSIPVGKLVLSLGGSFLVCGFLALAGAGQSDSDASALGVIGVVGAYWLVSAVLQVWWWSKGYDHFWRPMASWGLSLAGLLSFLGLPLLLLFWPRFRRWLFEQLKPYARPISPAEARQRSLDQLASRREAGLLGAAQYEDAVAEETGRIY